MLTGMILGSVASLLFDSALRNTGTHSKAIEDSNVTEQARAVVVREAAKQILLQKKAQAAQALLTGYPKDGYKTNVFNAGAGLPSSVSGRENRTTNPRRIPMSGPYEIVGNSDLLGAIGASLLVGDGGDALLQSLISGLVSGAGNTEIVGAGPGGQVKNAMQQALLEKVMSKGAGAVVQRDLNTRRRFPLGFVVSAVPVGQTVVVPAAPQNLFRSERVIIPSDIAFDLGITDIKVGNQSQLAQAVEVPAAMFTEVAIDTNVTFDTAEVGNQVTILVKNNSTDDVDFTGALLGTIAKA